MSILGGGPELGFCTGSSGNVYESATAGTFDATRARCSVAVGANADTSSYAEWAFSSSTATPNIGFMSYLARPGFGGSYAWLHVKDSSAVSRFYLNVRRIDGTGSLETTVTPSYWNGTAYIDDTANAFQINMALQKWDIAIDASASGGYTIYANRSPVVSRTGINLASLASSANTVRMYSPYVQHFTSEMILASESTVRMRGRTDPVTAVTAVADWSGAASDVDEIVYSDATGITSASANDVSIFTASSPTLEFNPLAVLVGARGAVGTTGPTGLQTALRIGSSNYFSSTTVQSAGYGAKVGIWNTDPSTSAAWGATNAAAAKPGVKSIA